MRSSHRAVGVTCHARQIGFPLHAVLKRLFIMGTCGGGAAYGHGLDVDLVSAYQRFICVTDDVPLRQIAESVDVLVSAFPTARAPAERLILRATCLEMALVWGRRQHARRRAGCPAMPCLPKALAGFGDYWTQTREAPGQALARWIFAFCEELDRPIAPLSQSALPRVSARDLPSR